MGPRADKGFTLIELMVVVAIVGLLAAIAVFMYSRTVSQARTVEVRQVFTEMANKQERYHNENNEYLSTGTDEADMWPAFPTKDLPDTIDPLPLTWEDLSLNFGKTELWCQYVVIAGVAGSTADGAIGATLIPDPAPENYWYGIAKCPFNGKTYVAKYNENKPVEYK